MENRQASPIGKYMTIHRPFFLPVLQTTLQEKEQEHRRMDGETVEDSHHDPKSEHMLMMRILGPIITFVNRPWKVRTHVTPLPPKLMGI